MGYPAEQQSYQASGSRESSFIPLQNLINAAVDERVFPGAVCCIAKENRLLFNSAHGHFSFQPFGDAKDSDANGGLTPVRSDTVYDVDSLTSSLVTTTLVMKAVQEGRVQLTDRLSRYIHGFGVFGKSPIRIIDLLLHQSGLPGSEAFYQQLGSLQKEVAFGTPVGRGTAQHLFTLLNRTEVRTNPGTQQQYSELGTLVLGHLVEELWARRIDQLADLLIFQPLEIKKSGFINHGMVRQGKLIPATDMIAPSEDCPWRRRILQGETRDENTWAIGGASGEAGLFTTAGDVTALLQNIMYAYHGMNDDFLTKDVVRCFLQCSGVDDHQRTQKSGGSWRLGWANTRSAFGVEAPENFSNAVGVVSPTGCGVWMDPKTCTSIVLLSNRTMPLRSNRKIVSWWPKFLQQAWKQLES